MFKRSIGFLIINILLLNALMIGCSKDENETQSTLETEKTIYDLGFKYTGEFVDLSPMEDDLEDNMIFFVGENHGMRENYIIKKEFLMYLKENNDIKYLLEEFSAADGYILNKYLKTGDITIIDDWLENLNGTYLYNKDNYEFIKWLYEYNNTLSKDDRIIVVGSDIVHQYATGLKVIQEILSNHNVPEEILEDVKNINSIKLPKGRIDEENGKRLSNYSQSLLDKLEKKENFYLENYGEDYIYLHGSLKGLVTGIEAYKHRKEGFYEFTKYRDKAMYEIFNKNYEYLPKGKYFGQWGNTHTYQKKPADVMWFANYLNEDSRYKDKIITVHLTYSRSRKMAITFSNGPKFYEVKYYDFESTKNTITQNYNDTNILYKLNEEGSIFSQVLEFNFNKFVKPTEGVTTDYVQYFIRLKHANPTEPLNK